MSEWCNPVVVVDSLDVLSLSRDHAVLSYFLEQIDRILLIPNVTIVAACRSFDVKYDRRLAERQWDHIVTAGPLHWDTDVGPLVTELGIDASGLDQATRNLLSNPRQLALFADIAERTGTFNVSTPHELSRRYFLDTVVIGMAQLSANLRESPSGSRAKCCCRVDLTCRALEFY